MNRELTQVELDKIKLKEDAMKLINHLDGDKELLEKFSTFMYFMNKEVARNSFVDFLEFCDLTYEEWKILKKWLNENGLKTYN